MRLDVPEEELIVIRRFESSFGPNIMPYIRGRRGKLDFRRNYLQISDLCMCLGGKREMERFSQRRGPQEILDRNIFKGGERKCMRVGVHEGLIRPKIFPE